MADADTRRPVASAALRYGPGLARGFASLPFGDLCAAGGSPAALGGVQPGDRILAIDNQAVRGKTAPDLVRMMRGEPGTSVLLTVRRKAQEKLLYFKLTRQIINVASVVTSLS